MDIRLCLISKRHRDVSSNKIENANGCIELLVCFWPLLCLFCIDECCVYMPEWDSSHLVSRAKKLVPFLTAVKYALRKC